MGKIVAITGAGDGLGRALARRCAKAGDTVVLLGRTLSKVEAVAAELGEGHLAVQCDVQDPDSVRAAFAQVAERFPRIDVLINNAAIYEPFNVETASDEQIRGQLDTNLAGPIYCTREAIPLLKGGGHLINISSESLHLKMPMLWLYAGTKAALELMSDMWAHELQPEGIRVTTVRAGQMMDETKTGSSWPPEVAMKFATENARVGINLRERGISHYNSAAETIYAVIAAPSDIHYGLVTLSARPRS